MTAVKTWAQLWANRLRAPMMRRQAPVGITHSGGVRRIYHCAVCGQERTMCAKWPMPVSLCKWIAEHNTDCARRAVLSTLDGSLAALGQFKFEGGGES